MLVSFLQQTSHRTQGNGLKLHWASLDQEWFLHGRGGQALKGAALGAGGVTMPTGIYKAREWHPGTWLSGRLRLDVLEGLFQPKCFYNFISLQTESEGA